MKNLIIKTKWTLKQKILVLFAIFAIALSLRTAAPFLKDRISKDGVLYVYLAKDLLSSNEKHPPFSRNKRIPPLYTYLMILTKYSTGLSLETSGYCVSILFGALLVLPVFFLTAMLFSPRVAAVSAFLIAVNPYLIRISSSVMRDSLFSFLLFCTLFFLAKAFHSSTKNFGFWILTGFFLSLSIACRNEAIEILGLIPAYLFFEFFFLKRKNPSLFQTGYFINAAVGVFLMSTTLYLTYLPLAYSLKETDSTWTLIDRRIPGYFNTLLKISKEDALKVEDTL